MVGDALSRFWHSRYYKVSRISKMLLSTVNSGPPESLRQRQRGPQGAGRILPVLQ